MNNLLVGDDTSALWSWLGKPFGSRQLTKGARIANYRISRHRRIVENTIGSQKTQDGS